MNIVTVKTTVGEVIKHYGVMLKESIEEAASQLVKLPSFETREVANVPFVRKFYVSEKILGQNEALQPGQIRHWITTNAVDRDGEIVTPKGGDLKSYRKNPMVLWGHDYSSEANIIGKNLSVEVDENGLKALTQFALRNEKAARIYDLFKDGFLRSWSIGFIPVKGHAPKPENKPPDLGPNVIVIDMNRPDPKVARWIHDKWMLLEYSAVAIPSNPEALTEEVAKGNIELSDTILKELELNVEEIRKRHPAPVTKASVYIHRHEGGHEEKEKQGSGEAAEETPAPGEGLGDGTEHGGGGSAAGPDSKGKREAKAGTVTCPDCGAEFTFDPEVADEEGFMACPECGTMCNADGAAKSKPSKMNMTVDIKGLPEVKALIAELASLKEGRVLSGKNRKLIEEVLTTMEDAATAMRAAYSALKTLHEATDPASEEEGDGATPTPPKKPSAAAKPAEDGEGMAKPDESKPTGDEKPKKSLGIVVLATPIPEPDAVLTLSGIFDEALDKALGRV